MARVSFIEKETAAPAVRELFEKLEAGGQQLLNIYKVIGHSSGIAPDFFRLANRILFRGKLPPPIRELAILRVGHLAQAPYEYTKHVLIGRKAGLSEAHIAAIPEGPSAAAYDERERAVLTYTDEVSRNYRASDESFAALRNHFDEEQVVELTIVIGFYEMICRVLEALQVELEDDFQPF